MVLWQSTPWATGKPVALCVLKLVVQWSNQYKVASCIFLQSRYLVAFKVVVWYVLTSQNVTLSSQNLIFRVDFKNNNYILSAFPSSPFPSYISGKLFVWDHIFVLFFSSFTATVPFPSALSNFSCDQIWLLFVPLLFSSPMSYHTSALTHSNLFVFFKNRCSL